MLFVLALLVIGVGLYPKPFTDVIGVSVSTILELASVTKN
jgi:NADH:ubiquinone oxidoreductase subunit 4 (subunit M)